jgi:hypothetical protein
MPVKLLASPKAHLEMNKEDMDITEQPNKKK